MTTHTMDDRYMFDVDDDCIMIDDGDYTLNFDADHTQGPVPGSAQSLNTDPARLHNTDPARLHNTDPARLHNIDSIASLNTDSVQSLVTDSVPSCSTDSVASHNTDSVQSHNTDIVQLRTTDIVQSHNTVDSVQSHNVDSVASRNPNGDPPINAAHSRCAADSSGQILFTGRPLQNLVQLIAHRLLHRQFYTKDDYAVIGTPLVHSHYNSFDDQIEAAVDTANTYVDDANLECKFLALDGDSFVAYVYYNLALRLFNTPFVSQLDTYELCRTACAAFDPNVIRRVVYMHSRFADQPNYNVHVGAMVFAWNDRILPGVHRELARGRRELAAFGCNDVMTLQRDRLPTVSLLDTREEEIRRIARLYASRYTTDELRALETRTSDSQAVQNFLASSASAVAINGVACSGKTTALGRLVQAVRREVDERADCLKATTLGGFAGKDDNQVLAMSYQYVSCATGRHLYTSLFDRCMFNNLLWRIILKMLDTREDMVDVFMRELRDISPLMLALMATEPIVVFVDTNVLQNRIRMRRRNEGGDSYRCMIENYTPAQNVVYGVFAYLCRWPVFDRGGSYGDDPEAAYNLLESMVLEKCRSNVARNGGALPGCEPFARHKLSVSGNTDSGGGFRLARQMQIFK